MIMHPSPGPSQQNTNVKTALVTGLPRPASICSGPHQGPSFCPQALGPDAVPLQITYFAMLYCHFVCCIAMQQCYIILLYGQGEI